MADDWRYTVNYFEVVFKINVVVYIQFKLEDATKSTEPPSTPSFIRRPGLQTNVNSRPSSAPVETADTTVTLPLRRPKSQDEKGKLYETSDCLALIVFVFLQITLWKLLKWLYCCCAFTEQDKENDSRNAQATLATQAAIQRRRRPKRRSTGVVTFDNVDVSMTRPTISVIYTWFLVTIAVIKKREMQNVWMEGVHRFLTDEFTNFELCFIFTTLFFDGGTSTTFNSWWEKQ